MLSEHFRASLRVPADSERVYAMTEQSCTSHACD